VGCQAGDHQGAKSYPESYWFMPVPYGYGKSTVDYLICHYGLFIGIEAKAPGKRPTARQRQIMEEIVAAGGVAFVIDDETTCHILRVFLEQVKQNATSPSQPQAQAGGRAASGKYPKPVSRREALDTWRRAAHPPAAPADGDVSPKEDGLRRAKPDPNALRLERRDAVRKPKIDIGDAHSGTARIRPERDGDGEDESGAVGVRLPQK
jgi:hypothetical protein